MFLHRHLHVTAAEFEVCRRDVRIKHEWIITPTACLVSVVICARLIWSEHTKFGRRAVRTFRPDEVSHFKLGRNPPRDASILALLFQKRQGNVKKAHCFAEACFAGSPFPSSPERCACQARKLLLCSVLLRKPARCVLRPSRSYSLVESTFRFLCKEPLQLCKVSPA